MKKNALTNAIIAGVAGVAGLASVANAVNLNPDGLGQVLIYPYYTVNGGNQTLLSVVNTTDVGKAVKVRFLEGYNSREVLDFNLYLSPYDVWTAAIFQTSDTSAANLITSDQSCTVPKIPAGGVAFVNFQYTGANNDAGPDSVTRTREGHFEIIEMAEIINAAGGEGSLSAITHAGGVPDNCAQVVSAWNAGGYWVADQTIDTRVPGGGLFGSGFIVDPANGTLIGYNAEAIDSFSAEVLHFNPGSTRPALKDANTTITTTDAIVFDSAGLVTSTYPRATQAIDAVSAVFSHDAIFNEFVTSAGAGATSEWVVTFPTKNVYVDHPAPVTPPFDFVFGAPGTSPVTATFTIFDREERTLLPEDVGFSPPPPDGADTTIDWETNVVTINQPGFAGGSAILGSNLAVNVEPDGFGIFDGWMRIGFDDAAHVSRPDSVGGTYLGLPVVGFWAVNFNGAGVPGILANYAGAFRHRGSRQYTIAP